ncbi:sulfatase [Nocardioides litoris]|uniref:sulfatase n=1 Tax=Nocardioides litoris TaxID=1926648 RepID=UPI0011244D71|nr:sulfatase [Nocardioides litoris]
MDAPPPRPGRRTVLRTASGALGGTLLAACTGGPDDRARPPAGPAPSTGATGPVPAGRPGGRRTRHNVVVVSVDDLGWRDLGCYGNTFNETPRIDALAATGVRFTQAYSAAPVCSPSRAALVTGRFPVRTGVTDFLGPADEPSDTFLRPGIPTVADLLRTRGYESGLVGKWHLSEDYLTPLDEREGSPRADGFDDVRLTEERYIGRGDYSAPYDFMETVRPLTDGEHLTDRLAVEAVSFLDDHADQPFFLHLSNYAVHTELAGPPDLVEKYLAKPGSGGTRAEAELAAMLERVDAQVGTVVDALRERGLAERTLVVLLSDNGGSFPATNAPLRGGKGDLYEGGIRVPTIAAWADGRRPGRVVDTPVITMDVVPTALDLAGASRTRARAELDGISLAPLLLPGRGRLAPREALFWDFPHHFAGRPPRSAIRVGDLKLVQLLRDGRAELYDLGRDPGETRDLARSRPGDRRRLAALLDQHVRELEVVPPAPGRRAYPQAGGRVRWREADVLTVLDRRGGASARPDGPRLRLSFPRTAQLVVRTDVAPATDRVVGVLDLGDLGDLGERRLPLTLQLGLAVDEDTFLFMYYRHDTRSVGCNMRRDGEELRAVRPQALDGTVDLGGPRARLAFVLDGATSTAYADEGRGRGWEYLLSVDTSGDLDWRDDELRGRARWALGARGRRAEVSVGRLRVRSR